MRSGLRPGCRWPAAAVVCLFGVLPGTLASGAGQGAAKDEPLARLRAAHRARPTDPQAALDLGLLLCRRDPASLEGRTLLEAAAPAFPRRHDVQLALLDSYLATSESAAATTLLGRLAPERERQQRFALDTLYVLLGRRADGEAFAEWNRLAPRIQESLREAPAPGARAESERQRRIAELMFLQGLLTARRGSKEEALQLLREADGHGFPPLDSPLMALAGDTLHELSEYTLAAQAYRELLKHRPDDAQARLRLGRSLYSSGELSAAQRELEQVVRREPTSAEAHYVLGAVLLEGKRSDEAGEHFDRALALDPRCAPCMAKLGLIAYMKGDDAQCRDWLTKAVTVDPDHTETSLVLGMLENRSGHPERAIEHLSRVVARRPQDATARYQLALAYQRNGDAEKAGEQRAIFDRLIEEQKAKTMGVRGSEK